MCGNLPEDEIKKGGLNDRKHRYLPPRSSGARNPLPLHRRRIDLHLRHNDSQGHSQTYL